MWTELVQEPGSPEPVHAYYILKYVNVNSCSVAEYTKPQFIRQLRNKKKCLSTPLEMTLFYILIYTILIYFFVAFFAGFASAFLAFAAGFFAASFFTVDLAFVAFFGATSSVSTLATTSVSASTSVSTT